MTVYVLGTGGTIGLLGTHHGDHVEYAGLGEFSSAQGMLGDNSGRVVFRQILEVRSPDLDLQRWGQLLAAVIEASRQPDCAGIVVAHGTATLEETAFWLNIVSPVDMPLVMVGSQRPQGVEGSDATTNLTDAVQAAADDSLHGLGVVVVMDGQILAARTVTKTHNYRVGAFSDRDAGWLGEVGPSGAVSLYYRPTRRHTVDSEFAVTGLPQGDRPHPRVEILHPHVGHGLEHVDVWLEHGLRGLVVAGYPPALNSEPVERCLDRLLEAGVSIALASRARGGRLVRRSEHSRRAIVTADNLSPQAARILLMEALRAGIEGEALQRIFDEY